ncbi:hypothetical protein LTR70_009707 [Exophiala xenobiotica]|uniref:small monomeric GTPase n=1 Tax=Lithohypha guttulata TaxID=1690604 RepID=A0ABR0JWM6_9EURO|nr:hypothetical protein LTR24_009594 [Lithohypha guttulata]KAK5310147.1 hypothetical protein LTR70_009707 [Exophiala xenobiotica]
MDPQSKAIKTVILGGERTGKTALVQKYTHSVFTEDYEPSFQGSDQKQISIEGQTFTLDLIPAEPAGEHILCQTGDAFILLYAINNRRSFQHITQLHQQIRSAKGPALSKIAVFLVGSKADRESERQVSLEEARQLAIELRCQKLFEVSAKTHGAEINDLFEKLVRAIITMENCSTTPSIATAPPLSSPSTRPPMTATPQSPSSPSFHQSQEPTTTASATSPATESPRLSRTSSVFDRLKFGSKRKSSSSLQTLTRKKSGSFSNIMAKNQSRDQLQNMQSSNDVAPPRSNVRSVSAGNVLNSVHSATTTARPVAPPSRHSNTATTPTTATAPSLPTPSPYKLDVDTSSWRESIQWPTEIISEEDMVATRR